EVSQWADEERILPPEAAAEPGRWETSRAVYQRGVMDAFSDSSIHTVVVIKASQLGYTECLLNVCGYFMDQEPCPILVVQPSIENAENWSKDRLTPMLRDTPCLRYLVRDPSGRRAADDTLRN